MRPRALIATYASWVLALGHSVALACPDCVVGRAAREQFWRESLLLNLAAGLAPFIVIVAASVWTERIGRS